jgi:hypothetical protein
VDESRLPLGFPLSSKVFLEQRCESGVEVVQEPVAIVKRGQTMLSSPPPEGLVLDIKDWAQKPVVCGVDRDFHFSEPSTVTTSFIGFYFDISEVFKVAPPDGRFGLCR